LQKLKKNLPQRIENLFLGKYFLLRILFPVLTDKYNFSIDEILIYFSFLRIINDKEKICFQEFLSLKKTLKIFLIILTEELLKNSCLQR